MHEVLRFQNGTSSLEDRMNGDLKKVERRVAKEEMQLGASQKLPKNK